MQSHIGREMMAIESTEAVAFKTRCILKNTQDQDIQPLKKGLCPQTNYFCSEHENPLTAAADYLARVACLTKQSSTSDGVIFASFSAVNAYAPSDIRGVEVADQNEDLILISFDEIVQEMTRIYHMQEKFSKERPIARDMIIRTSNVFRGLNLDHLRSEFAANIGLTTKPA